MTTQTRARKILTLTAMATAISFSIGVKPCRSAPDSVLVRLFQAHPDLKKITLIGPVRLNERGLPDGKYNLIARGGTVCLSRARDTRSILTARRFTIYGAGRPISLIAAAKPRRYAGTISVRADGDKLVAVDCVHAQDYVASVVGSETHPDWPVEALKAQAVLTQTRLQRHNPSEELADTTQDEAYLGTDYARRLVRAAVQSVWGQYLAHDNRPAQVFYHSTCAGMTSKGTDVFGKAASAATYLRSVKCDYCKQSPFWKPTVTEIESKPFATVFGEALPVVQSKDAAGRPISISLPGDDAGRRAPTQTPNHQELSGYQFWILLGQKFGWDKAPGLRFSLGRSADDKITITSTGAGHGVGLCQWGAAGQARLGHTYREILQYYFRGTSIRSIQR